jgi:hypothetical protein
MIRNSYSEPVANVHLYIFVISDVSENKLWCHRQVTSAIYIFHKRQWKIQTNEGVYFHNYSQYERFNIFLFRSEALFQRSRLLDRCDM